LEKSITAKGRASRIPFSIRILLLELDKSPLSRDEIRAWIDTEGHIESKPPPKSSAQIRVVQKHREPLDCSAESLEEMRARCKVVFDKSDECYVAKVFDVRGVAKVIREAGPFRTPQRRNQVRRLMENLTMARKARRRAIESSKMFLGL